MLDFFEFVMGSDMIENFYKYLGALHDARLYGFLLDWNPELWKFDIILYVHIFSDFDC